jgi:hypothetical protein
VYGEPLGKLLFKGSMSMWALERIVAGLTGVLCDADRKMCMAMDGFRAYFKPLPVPAMTTPANTALPGGHAVEGGFDWQPPRQLRYCGAVGG